MSNIGIFCGLLAVFSTLLFIPKNVKNLCDTDTCPYCYGEDFCEEIKDNKVTLRYDSIGATISNVISVKNVYFAKYKDKNIVLKKLAHNSEISDFNSGISINNNLKICDEKTKTLFLERFQRKLLKNFQTILQINAEPLLVELFPKSDGFPVPNLLGYCGRAVLVEDSGENLNNFANCDWYRRAYVAYQLLVAAEKFTNGHKEFRLYLTDISPDNIAVDENLTASIVDLENAVILKKNGIVSKIHTSHHFEEGSYIFSEQDLCSHDLSDHNVYSICWLILSKDAPWPMMSGGLLHSPPLVIISKHYSLLNKIEECVKSENARFSISLEIKNQLKNILIGRYDVR